jgi:pyridoxine 4-dehydrogenase
MSAFRRTWSWGNRFLWQYKPEDDLKLKETYDFVVRNGINWFDTADSYGTGELVGRSEELLGKFSNSAPSNRITVNFCTKLAPYPWRIGSESFLQAHRESNKRLQRSVDIVQLHWPPSLQWQEANYLRAFSQMVNNKSATQIGVSNYGPRSIERVNRILNSHGQQLYTNQVG